MDFRETFALFSGHFQKFWQVRHTVKVVQCGVPPAMGLYPASMAILNNSIGIYEQRALCNLDLAPITDSSAPFSKVIFQCYNVASNDLLKSSFAHSVAHGAGL